MTSEQLEEFRCGRGWNKSRLASELEISRDWLRGMLTGARPVPKHIALAIAAMAFNLPPYGGDDSD